ncbi:spore germination protein [Bacillus aryabhattai]|nr:spore germination protein [Priestia aryabhattai]
MFFKDTPDLTVRHLELKKDNKQAVLIYLSSLIDKDLIHEHILYPLINSDEYTKMPSPSVTIGKVESSNNWNDIEVKIFQGESILLIDGQTEAMILGTPGWPQRAIEDPQLETSLKGAHIGFGETSERNIALIRRYIPNRQLKIKEMTVGSRSRSKVSILYLEDVVNPELLQELKNRIEQIHVDFILNTGELEQFIEDNPYSPFPQFISTERPDAAASHIFQGRMIVMVDGSSAVLVTPVTLISFFQNVDDYGSRLLSSNFIRLLRVVSFFIAILLPSLYISLISFNYELIPIKILLNIGKYRSEVPFPPFIEALIMEISLEMLREAGVRLPAPIGQTVGIVGAIVIGQAAVQAGIVSNMMIIVVSSTAIASFIIPNYDMSSAIRLLRFPMMLIASWFGIVGIVIGLMTIIGHIISLESLGTPYASPFAPIRFPEWKDTFIRFPLWKMVNRPSSAKPVQVKRQGTNRFRRDEQ